MKVWVVQEYIGSYDDSEEPVVGVFATEQQAKDWIRNGVVVTTKKVHVDEKTYVAPGRVAGQGYTTLSTVSPAEIARPYPYTEPAYDYWEVHVTRQGALIGKRRTTTERDAITIAATIALDVSELPYGISEWTVQ